MKCPECGNENLYTINSRPFGEIIRRRKECGCCGYRFNTYESRMYLDKESLLMIKKALDYYKENNKLTDKDKKTISKVNRFFI